MHMSYYNKKFEIKDTFSPGWYLLKVALFFAVAFSIIGIHRFYEYNSRLEPVAARERFMEEARDFHNAVENMHHKHFDFSAYKKSRVFFKKFAGFFNLESLCDNYSDACLWNNLTYRTLDGEILPVYYGTPNVGQFRVKSGALYMLYTYGENDLWIFVDGNGINRQPNRFGLGLML